MNEQKTETKRDGHLTIYLIWPALAGLVLATLLAVSVGGIAGMVTRSLAVGATWAGFTFFVVLGLGTSCVFLYAAREWAGPRYLGWVRQTVDVIDGEPVEPVVETRFIPVKARHNKEPAPALPARTQVVDDRSLLTRIRAAIAPPVPEVIEMPKTIEAIEPTAAGWAIEFYNVLNTMWGKPLSRRSFEHEFSDRGQAIFYAYVGRSPPCEHRHRGLWQTWGIISQTGPRKSWEFCQTLDVIYSLDPELQTYAIAKSGLVQYSPTQAPVNRKRAVMATPNRTEPLNQSKNHWSKGA